jgi:hypothetical protein
VGERSQQSFELSGSIGEGQGISSSVETYTINAAMGFVGNEANASRMLELALEEEKAAHAAIYLELEKERAAAASAADETIAMILRLQQDKASVEMEARQYQRMIEEKFAYDEEEMNILKEILVRREKENHFLEKEIEEYRQMRLLEHELPKGDLNDKLNSWGQWPSSSQDLDDEEQLRLQIENNMSTGKKVRIFSNSPSNYEAPIVEKQCQNHGYGFLERNVNLAGKEMDNSIVCQRITSEPAQIFCGIEMKFSCDSEKLEKDGENMDQASSNHHGSMLDTEPAVYDVHVIDDKNGTWKEQSGKESGSSISNAFDEPRDCAVALGTLGVWSSDAPSDHPIISMADPEPNIHEGSLDRAGELPVLSHSQCKSLLSEFERESLSAVNNEKLKIDIEIEWLRERLRIVQEEKENLTLNTENGDREKDPLKLLEEISNQLQEIK